MKMRIIFLILSHVGVASSAFLLAWVWQQRRNSSQIKKMIGELKASTDALEKSVKENQQ